MTTTTVRDEAEEAAGEEAARLRPPYVQEHARPRTRGAAFSAATQRARGWLARRGEESGKPGSEVVREMSRAQPPSLTGLVEYTAAGDWVPGERHPILEGAGKAYGYGLALPVSVGLYAGALAVQRPTRLVLVLIVAAVVWIATGPLAIAAVSGAGVAAASLAVFHFADKPDQNQTKKDKNQETKKGG